MRDENTDQSNGTSDTTAETTRPEPLAPAQIRGRAVALRRAPLRAGLAKTDESRSGELPRRINRGPVVTAAPAQVDSRVDSTMQLPGAPLVIAAAPSQKLGMSSLVMN